jgi:uncharacterized protein YdeI (YjbR/CyaY-like superfamily)
VDRIEQLARSKRLSDVDVTATVPGDLEAALDANAAAREAFAGLSSQNRYAILYRLQDAKRPDTRARRIATFVEMLARGETLH